MFLLFFFFLRGMLINVNLFKRGLLDFFYIRYLFFLLLRSFTWLTYRRFWMFEEIGEAVEDNP